MMISGIKYTFFKDAPEYNMNDLGWMRILGKALPELKHSARADTLKHYTGNAYDIINWDEAFVDEQLKELKPEMLQNYLCHVRDYDAVEVSRIVEYIKRNKL